MGSLSSWRDHTSTLASSCMSLASTEPAISSRRAPRSPIKPSSLSASNSEGLVWRWICPIPVSPQVSHKGEHLSRPLFYNPTILRPSTLNLYALMYFKKVGEAQMAYRVSLYSARAWQVSREDITYEKNPRKPFLCHHGSTHALSEGFCFVSFLLQPIGRSSTVPLIEIQHRLKYILKQSDMYSRAVIRCSQHLMCTLLVSPSEMTWTAECNALLISHLRTSIIS